MSPCRPTSSRWCCGRFLFGLTAVVGDGAAAARRAPARPGRAADLRRAARRLRGRGDRRRLHRRAAARGAVERVDRAARLRAASRSARPCSALSPRQLGDRARRCWSAAPAGCWRWRSSTPRCSSRPRAGWSGGRWRSTRPRPSAAWRSAAGSGAASPRRTGRRGRCCSPPRRWSPFGAVGLRLPLPARAELDLDPLNRWTEPQVGIDLKPRSGPISIIDRVPDRRARTSRTSSAPWPSASASAAATARGTGRCCATSRPAALGRELPDRRPGSSTSGTTSAAPRPTPSSADRLRALHRGRRAPVVHRRHRAAGPLLAPGPDAEAADRPSRGRQPPIRSARGPSPPIEPAGRPSGPRPAWSLHRHSTGSEWSRCTSTASPASLSIGGRDRGPAGRARRRRGW